MALCPSSATDAMDPAPVPLPRNSTSAPPAHTSAPVECFEANGASGMSGEVNGSAMRLCRYYFAKISEAHSPVRKAYTVCRLYSSGVTMQAYVWCYV
jgi:hypothetical protein